MFGAERLEGLRARAGVDLRVAHGRTSARLHVHEPGRVADARDLGRDQLAAHVQGERVAERVHRMHLPGLVGNGPGIGKRTVRIHARHGVRERQEARGADEVGRTGHGEQAGMEDVAQAVVRPRQKSLLLQKRAVGRGESLEGVPEHAVHAQLLRRTSRSAGGSVRGQL